MTHLVFVHGVNVRKDPDNNDYEEGVEHRDKAFRSIAFEGSDLTIYNPYWGEFGAPDEYKALDMGGDMALSLESDSPYSGDTRSSDADLKNTISLLTAAQQDFFALANSLSVILNDPASNCYDADLALALANYVLLYEKQSKEEVLSGGQSTRESPGWVNDGSVANDQEFLERLENEALFEAQRTEQSLGLKGALKKAGGWLAHRAADIAGGAVADLARNMTPKLALFLGDAFIYLDENSEARAQMQEVVLDAIIAAGLAAKADGSPLVLVGHSMGANILYDMLKSPAMVDKIKAQVGDDFSVNLFLTVGTQVGLLQELGLFGDAEASRPDSCKYWWHVYNEMDVLSFGAAGIFDGVIQFSCDTNANIINAHGAYFTSPVFQKRLHKRLGHLGIV